MSARWYYICDHCGSIVTITDAPIPEGQDWQCADCGSSAMWEFDVEFDDESNAMRQARHIQATVRSGLFRGARR